MSRLAFLVLAHADPAHLLRLIARLRVAGDVYVHIDAKTDIGAFADALKQPGVFPAKHRYSIDWAGFTMVEATLGLMRQSLAAGEAYSHLVLLSGSCYPLRSLAELKSQLDAAPTREVIRYIDMRQSPDHYLKQIHQRWFKRPLYRSSIRPLALLDKAIRRVANWLRLPNSWPSGVVPYFGSQWWALTAPCCRYVLDYVNGHPEFVAANRFSFSPDEHFFHTVVGNSPFAPMADGVQPFVGVGTFRMANLHVIDPSLQRWFGEADWPELSRSERFFVRKVGTSKSERLLDLIDQHRLRVNSGS